jgi:Predicted oxidoreductases (related to aryl-alcohol dehydrogenases)
MKKGKTESGFKYEIDEKVLDDMELIDAMAASQGEDPTQISVVVLKIFGAEQRKRLYDHVRADDGRVPIDEVAKIITEIINSLGDDGKN